MLKVIEKVFSVAMLFYSTYAVSSLVFGIPDGAVRTGVNVPALTVQVAFYAVAFCFIAIRWRPVLRAAWNAKWILALVAIAVASSAWSQDPLFTLRRSIVLLATTLYAIYFGGRFTITEQLRLFYLGVRPGSHFQFVHGGSACRITASITVFTRAPGEAFLFKKTVSQEPCYRPL